MYIIGFSLEKTLLLHHRVYIFVQNTKTGSIAVDNFKTLPWKKSENLENFLLQTSLLGDVVGLSTNLVVNGKDVSWVKEKSFPDAASARGFAEDIWESAEKLLRQKQQNILHGKLEIER